MFTLHMTRVRSEMLHWLMLWMLAAIVVAVFCSRAYG